MNDKPRTLTANLERGHETQVLVTLQGAGVTPEEYAAIGKDPWMQQDIIEVFTKHRLFTSPEAQINYLLEINDAVWHDPDITSGNIIHGLQRVRSYYDYHFYIGNVLSVPEWPASHRNGLYAVTLVYDTGNVRDTFIRNLQAFAFAMTEEDKALFETAMADVESNLKNFQDIRLCRTAIPRTKGARWVVCELGRTLSGCSAESARRTFDECNLMGIGPELPLIAAMHRNWVLAMNGNDIPFLIVSDLVFEGLSGQLFVPRLEKGRGRAEGDWPVLNYIEVDDTMFPANGGPGYLR